MENGAMIEAKALKNIKKRMTDINCDLSEITQRTKTIYGDLEGKLREDEVIQTGPSEGHIQEINHKLDVAEHHIKYIKKDLSDIEGVV